MKIPRANWNNPDSWFYLLLVLCCGILLATWVGSWLWYQFVTSL